MFLSFLLAGFTVSAAPGDPIVLTAKIEGANRTGAVLAATPISAEGKEAIEAWLADPGRGAVRLQIQGVQNPGDNVIGFRVFLNKPDADWLTPLADPHYVTSVAFGQGGEDGFVVSLGGTIRQFTTAKILDLGKPLVITLVPVADEEGQAPKGRALVVERVAVVIAEK